MTTTSTTTRGEIFGARRLRAGVLTLTCTAGLLFGGPAGAEADAAAFDPATLCPAATTNADQLWQTVVDRVAATTTRAVHEGLDLRRQLTISSVAEASSSAPDTWSTRVTLDAAARRLSQTELPASRGSENIVTDDRTDLDYRQLNQGTRTETRSQRRSRATFEWLGTTSVWLKASALSPIADRLESGLQVRLTWLPDYYQDATFSCTVQGNVMTAEAVGEPGVNRLVLTVNDTGELVAFDERVRAPSAEDLTLSGTLAYGAQTVALPQRSFTTADWRRAEVSAVAAQLRGAVLGGATAKVRRSKTLGDRVRILRVVAKSKDAWLNRTYGYDPKRVSVTRGSRLTVSNDDGKAVLTVRVKGRKIVSSLHLPAGVR